MYLEGSCTSHCKTRLMQRIELNTEWSGFVELVRTTTGQFIPARHLTFVLSRLTGRFGVLKLRVIVRSNLLYHSSVLIGRLCELLCSFTLWVWHHERPRLLKILPHWTIRRAWRDRTNSFLRVSGNRHRGNDRNRLPILQSELMESFQTSIPCNKTRELIDAQIILPKNGFEYTYALRTIAVFGSPGRRHTQLRHLKQENNTPPAN